MMKARAMHFMNQFFAGIGGEEKADVAAGSFEGPVGPGKRLQELLGDAAEIVVTGYCGDDYFAKYTEKAVELMIKIARERNVTLLIAGPAFASGRHGFACAQVCHAVSSSLGLNCIAAMHPENPGIETYKQYKDRKVYIFPTSEAVSGMAEALSKMARFVPKLTGGLAVEPPSTAGYIARGFRQDEAANRSGAERAVEMVVNKVAGRPFITEIPLEILERVPPAPAITNLANVCIALATSSGVLPKGNPDGFKAHRNVQWRKYSVDGLDTMKDTGWDVLHSGYNNVFMKENPNFGVPLDACRQMERDGHFGKLYGFFYTTSGCNGSVPAMQRIGREVVADMKSGGIGGALFVST